ncbi:hypothetical protein [Pontibacter chitinilyticus]|uniref:hypothetical protein n=1 Tax=Pontibacter chitinilyticus TaxID=2674989 RepID=UPI0032193604
MSGKEITAKQPWLSLFGLVFLMLFTLQVKSAAGCSFPSSYKAASAASSQSKEQRHSYWQVQETNHREGLIPDWQLTVAATITYFLLLLFHFPSQKERLLPSFLSYASRNFCCIVPKGP